MSGNDYKALVVQCMKYMQHESDCQSHGYYSPNGQGSLRGRFSGACTCGLDQLLPKLRAATTTHRDSGPKGAKRFPPKAERNPVGTRAEQSEASPK